jgi:hypothetical protein
MILINNATFLASMFTPFLSLIALDPLTNPFPTSHSIFAKEWRD